MFLSYFFNGIISCYYIVFQVILFLLVLLVLLNIRTRYLPLLESIGTDKIVNSCAKLLLVNP